MDPGLAAAGSGVLDFAGNLIGGLMGQADKASDRAVSEAHYWNNYNHANQQFQWQKQLAMEGIGYKVRDAIQSGIHPLYALGASNFNYSPVSITDPGVSTGSPMGDAFSRMGQGLSRAMLATATREERKMSLLETERYHLQNELLRSQIRANNNSGQIGPPMQQVSSGGNNKAGPVVPPAGGVGQYQDEPSKVVTSQQPAGGLGSTQAGPSAPYVKMVDIGNGFRPMPADNLKVEDEFGAPLMAQWIADIQTNPHHYPPTQGQVDAKYGKNPDGTSRVKVAEFYWDVHRQGWLRYDSKAHINRLPKEADWMTFEKERRERLEYTK